MTHASVFSGIGGPEVAATMLGWENLFHCEINPFGKRVLDYWYPNAESYDDITKTDFTKWRGRVDVLTGGFPCQPFSYAGRRKGADDDRYLWPHMFRCIDEIRPTWVVAENVAGITTMVEQGKVSEVASQATLFGEGDTLHRYQLRETYTLERICHDLESHGYSVQPILIPACAVGAPHRRDRVFIIARRVDATDTANGRVSGFNDNRKQCDERLARQSQQSGEQSCVGNQQGRDTASDEEQVRRPEHASADSPCGGEGAPRTGESIEGGGCDTNQQQSEWGAASEWNHRLHAVLRPSADTESGGHRRGMCEERGSEQWEVQQKERKRCEMGSEDKGCCGKRTSSDTNDTRERTPDKPSGREWEKMDGERRDESFDGAWRLGTPRTSANTDNEGLERHGGQELQSHQGGQATEEHAACGSGRLASHSDSHRGCKVDEHMESELADGAKPVSNGGQRNVADTDHDGRSARIESGRSDNQRQTSDGQGRIFQREVSGLGISWDAWGRGDGEYQVGERWQNFPSVSPVHRGNDGIPFNVDCLTLSFGKWRTEALKAYGNAIVPQVMYEIFRAIEMVEK